MKSLWRIKRTARKGAVCEIHYFGTSGVVEHILYLKEWTAEFFLCLADQIDLEEGR